MNRLLVLLVLLALVACEKSAPLQPEEAVQLQLTVTPTGTPDSPVSISTEVINAGSETLRRFDGCSFWVGGTSLHIESIDGTHAYDLFHNALCPDSMVRFDPGEHLKGTTSFASNIFRGGGDEAPPGPYRVFLRFQAWPAGADPPGRTYECTANFTWETP
jgi:hypothetical protein